MPSTVLRVLRGPEVGCKEEKKAEIEQEEARNGVAGAPAGATASSRAPGGLIGDLVRGLLPKFSGWDAPNAPFGFLGRFQSNLSRIRGPGASRCQYL